MSIGINLIAFVILTGLWIAFGAALLFNREMLDNVWDSFRDLPALVQVIIGIVALPVALGCHLPRFTFDLYFSARSLSHSSAQV